MDNVRKITKHLGEIVRRAGKGFTVMQTVYKSDARIPYAERGSIVTKEDVADLAREYAEGRLYFKVLHPLS